MILLIEAGKLEMVIKNEFLTLAALVNNAALALGSQLTF